MGKFFCTPNLFDKKLLFDGRLIKQEKNPVKENNWAEGKGTEGAFWRKWDYARLELKNRLIMISI
jgi:hypothetical protein